MNVSPLEIEENAKGRNTAYNNQMMDQNVKLDKHYENLKDFTPGKKYHYSDFLFRIGDPSCTPSKKSVWRSLKTFVPVT